MALLPSFYQVQLAFAPLPPFAAGALAEIEVETSIDGASMFRLHFDLARTMLGDFDALAPDLFRPLLPVRISISFGLGLPLTLVNGHIRDVRLSLGDGPGTARLEVTGADKLGTLMGNVQMPIPWLNMPDSAITAAILGKYGIVPAVFATPPTRTVLDASRIQQARDNAFLQQMASFHAYRLFLQPDPLAGIDFGYFQPVSMMLGQPPQGVLSIDFGTQSTLTSFSLTNEMLKPTTVMATFIDPQTRVPTPISIPAAAELPMGLEPSLARIVPPPIEVEESSEAANIAEKTLQATARVTESARTISAQGEVDGLKFGRPLLPGKPVLVRGAGRQYSGLYLVTSVSHRLSRDGYTQSFEAMRNAVGLTGAELFVDPLAPVR